MELARQLDRRELAAIGAIVTVVVVMAIIVIRTLGGAKAEDAVATFLVALQTQEYEAAAALTDGDQEQVATALEANVDGLDGAPLAVRLEEVSEDGDEATASVRMTWSVPDIGEFSYSNNRIRLSEEDNEWLVAWSERVVHPQLGSGQRLGTVEVEPPRAPILDRARRALVTLRPVVEIGAIPGELDDVDAAVDAIAAVTDVDPKALKRAIEAAEPDSFVPAITLRQEEFDAIEGELRAVPGLEFGERELPLAPTRDFARVVLGSVGPVTAEQLEQSEGELDADDQIGQSGLQAVFEEHLAGTPEHAVVIRNAQGEEVDDLETVEGEPGEPLVTTLDLNVQAAAEEALGGVEGKAALVAVEPASGDILAAANRPSDDGFNRAMAGQYPPGSTFKVVTTTALLAAGVDPNETVECPETINVGGREFRNFEGSAAGAVPFYTDFAQSCNTAFVSLTERLAEDDLSDTAESFFGFDRDYDLALESFSGRVPRGRDEVERAAAMIGQARVLASPLAMAGVAATAVSGTWHQPRLLDSDPSEEGEPLPAEDAETLRALMRFVVTSGTGTALASVPGEPIGKSGTAEYGSGDPPPTHAWFLAARDDVAVAVIVEGGESGGEVAAPIVAEFLAALPEATTTAG